MKLRILDNSIRLRLSRTEVAAIRSDGIVGGKVSFAGGSRLIYCLEGSPACVDPAAQFADGELLVRLPEATVVQWADSDEVSIEATQPLDDGGSLKILIEKDFACLTPREGEDESDLYPHPQEGETNC
jgi:hypothetical protein